MVDLVIRGGKVVTAGHTLPPSWIAVDGGKIVALGNSGNEPEAKQTIDASGKYVLPGIIDPEHHPVPPLHENLFSETRAALSAGITTVGFMQVSRRLDPKTKQEDLARTPDDVPLFGEVIPKFIELAEKTSMVDFWITPKIYQEKQAQEIPELAEKYGITSFKHHLHTKAGEHMWPMFGRFLQKMGAFYMDDGTIFRSMKNVAALGPPAILVLHCENWEIARFLKEELIAQGRTDIQAWEEHSPDYCEAGHFRNYAYYAKIAGCPLYNVHTTNQRTIDEVVKARADGVRVWAQCAPHYLTLTEWRINPPLRSKESHDACWHALKTGLIDCIGSDHFGLQAKPEELAEVHKAGGKWRWDAWTPATRSLSSTAEALLPIMLSEGVNKGRISLERLVEVCCENPARSFGLYPKKGTISIGSDADFTIVDLDKTKKVTRDMIYARSGWSIWEGWEFKGWPVMAILRGNVMMEWPEGQPRKVVDKPIGRYMPRKPGHELYPLD